MIHKKLILKFFRYPNINQYMNSISQINIHKTIMYNFHKNQRKSWKFKQLQNGTHNTTKNYENHKINHKVSNVDTFQFGQGDDYTQIKQDHDHHANQLKLLQDNKGYGYYNWNDQNSYLDAVNNRYFLRDLICGVRKLKQNKNKFNQKELYFMAYTNNIFPQFEDQIMQIFIPSFIELQSMPNALSKNPQYITPIKWLCATFKKNNPSNKHAQIIQNHLRKRLNYPPNLSSLQSLSQNISHNCFYFMGNLTFIFDSLVTLVLKQINSTKYKLHPKTIKIISEILQQSVYFDPYLKAKPFLALFPQLYKQNQQYFNNLLQLLIKLLTQNIIGIVGDTQILQLNKKISTCTKYTSIKTKKLLRNYAQHLVVNQKYQLINFQNLLDCL